MKPKRLYLPEHNEPPPKLTVRNVRAIHDDDLQVFIYQMQAPVPQAILQAEQRRREAWRGPAGRAFWISCAALSVALLAALIALASLLTKAN